MSEGSLFQQYFDDNHLETLKTSLLATMVYPDIDVRVLASQIPPRHKMFEYLIERGRGQVESVFKTSSRRMASPNLVYHFPERWLSPAEECAFIDLIWKHPMRKGTKRLYILTCSAVILTAFPNVAVKVLTQNEGDQIGG